MAGKNEATEMRVRIVNGSGFELPTFGLSWTPIPGDHLAITFCFQVHSLRTTGIKGNGNRVFASPLSTPQLPGAGDLPPPASEPLVQRHRSD